MGASGKTALDRPLERECFSLMTVVPPGGTCPQSRHVRDQFAEREVGPVNQFKVVGER
jgi:hypothetical protein